MKIESLNRRICPQGVSHGAMATLRKGRLGDGLFTVTRLVG